MTVNSVKGLVADHLPKAEQEEIHLQVQDLTVMSPQL